MINIPHIDKHIWDAEYRALEIVAELQRTGSATIAIDNEGSDLAELGLYRLLDDLCGKFGFDKSSILIQTRNQLESHSEYKIQKFSPMHLLTPCHDFVKRTTIADKQFNDIKHFGIFISRSNWQRLMLGSYLYKNYKPTTLQTYHYDSNSDYHKSHLSFDTLAHLIGLANAADLTKELFASLPITNDTIDSYPIVTKDYLNISKLYKHFFVEIVCETFSEGKTFFPTEKIWRPIMCKTPFIVQGPVNYLHNLKQLGFKTFSRWWDESYDEDGGLTAIATIQRNIDTLSTRDVQQMHIEMQDTLEHNFQRFMELKSQDFTRIYGN